MLKELATLSVTSVVNLMLALPIFAVLLTPRVPVRIAFTINRMTVLKCNCRRVAVS